jgi:hypothetical protein
MATLTDFRNQLIAELETDMGIDVNAGMLSEAREDRDIGCCWIASVTSPVNTLEQVLDVRVRLFPRWKPEEGVTAYDPAPLEDYAERLQASLKNIQTTAVGMWFFRVDSVTIDIETWGVEAVLYASHDNPFLA